MTGEVSSLGCRTANAMEKHALLIANSKYNDERLNSLNAPTEDVIALKAVLDDEKIGEFASVEPVINASLEQIQKDLKAFLSDRRPDDLIVIYYTGHGLIDSDGKLWMALAGSSAEDPEIGSLDADYLRRSMDRCRSKQQLIILDCCHSGAMVEGVDGGIARAKNGATRPAILKGTFDPEGYGRCIMASSSSTQQSLEIGKRSLYTKILVEGLRDGKAAPEKVGVSVADLADYAAVTIRNLNVSMKPILAGDKEKMAQLVLAKNPCVRRPVPRDLIEALHDEHDRERRLGAISSIMEYVGKRNDLGYRVEIERLLQERLDHEQNISVHKALELALSGFEIERLESAAGRSGNNTDGQEPPKSPRLLKFLVLAIAAMSVVAIGSYGLMPVVISWWNSDRLEECQDKWILQNEYDKCFWDLIASHWPSKVEGQLARNGGEEYRGHWVVYPNREFTFMSCMSLMENRYEAIRSEIKSCGGTETWHSSFFGSDGVYKHQATWVLEKSCVNQCL